MKKKRLLTTSLAISVGLHITLLTIFYTQPVFLRPYLNTALGKSSPEIVIPLGEEDINLSEKNIALEEIFNQIVLLPPHLRKPYDFEQATPLEVKGQPILEPTLLDFPHTDLIANLPGEKQISEEAVIPTPALSLPTEILNESLVINTSVSPITPQLSNDRTPHLEYVRELHHIASSTSFETDNQTLKLDIHYVAKTEEVGVKPAIANTVIEPLSLPLDASELIALVSPDKLLHTPPAFTHEPIATNFIAKLTIGPQSKPSSLPSFESYGFAQSLNTVEWNDDFEIDIRAVKQEEGGYLFSLALLPKYDLTSQRIKQNYYFLIDRSNSIDKHRYQTFKRAVSKALTTLHQEDAFNIIIFDNKTTKLSKNLLPFSKKSVQLAEDFLEKQQHGTYFAATDIYSVLSKIIPADVPEDESHTAILITEGDSPLHPEKQRKLIHSWLQKNNGSVSLYTACVGEGNNKTFLDLLSSLGRGSLLYSDTHASFPRKLAKLVIDLRYPIAKDLKMTIVKADPSSNLKLYPASIHLPSLFSNHPYIIFGTTDKLSSFTLLLEGRNKNKVLSITKTISFDNAKPDSRFLSQKWKTMQAYQYYETYMQNGQISLLQKAESLFKK